MPSDRATAALVAATLAYAGSVGTTDEDEARQRLVDTASIYQRSSSDGVSRCSYCGVEVRPHTIGSFRKVEGWAEVRRKGGTHALSGQRATGEVACEQCMKERRLGIAPEQASLL